MLSDLSKLNNQESQNKYLNKAKNDFNEFVLYDEFNDTSMSFLINVVSNSKNFNGSVKLYNQYYIVNRVNKTSEGDWSRNFVNFNYLGTDYSNYNDANIEELTISNGLITGMKLYNNSAL